MSRKACVTLILLILSSVIILVKLARASPVYVTVYVSPTFTEVSPGDSFSVGIAISNVTELSGYSIALLYDSTILNGSSITEGPFLGGSTFFYIANFTDNLNATHGVAYFVSILTTSPPGASGDGILASLNFTAKMVGYTTLHFWPEYTSLTNSSIIKIPFATSDGSVRVRMLGDIAITEIKLSQNNVLQGDIVQINVTATNQGERTETFNITTYYDNNTIATQNVPGLAATENTTLTFSWNTTGITPDDYAIKAEASTVPDEIDLDDNTLVDGTIKVMKHPTASFTYSPLSPRAGETVTFNASSSTPDGGTIASYSWDFDDGNTTTTSNSIIAHVYSSEGTYNINLTVTDSDGLGDFTWQPVGIGVPLSHDLTIINLTCPIQEAYAGQQVTVNVTVENQGDFVETCNVTAYYDTNIIGNQTVLELNPGGNTTLTFIWNTTEVTPSQTYTLQAEVTPVMGETETSDNTFVDGTIRITPKGETNVRVDPRSTISSIGGTVTLNLTASEVLNLYGWDIRLYYRNDVLNLTEIVEGPFLRTAGDTFFYIVNSTNAYNATHGRLAAVCMLSGAIIGANGNGTLATITFQSIGQGNTTIDLYFTDLIDSEGKYITHSTTNGEIIVALIMGDINGDGRVDYKDLFLLAIAYGSRVGDLKYNPACDFDNDQDVDYKDLFTLAANYGFA